MSSTRSIAVVGVFALAAILGYASGNALDPHNHICGFHFPPGANDSHVIARTTPGIVLSAFTINYWAYFQQHTTASYVMSAFVNFDGGLAFSSLVAWFTEDTTIAIGKWIQVTQTWDSTTGRTVIYIDGHEAKVAFTGWDKPITPDGFFVLGQKIQTPSQEGPCDESQALDERYRFVGYLTHLRFWNHILADDQLEEILAGNTTLSDSIPVDNVLMHPFEVKDGAQSFAYDCSQCPDLTPTPECHAAPYGYWYWDYNEQESLQWDGICTTGSAQSPIDIPEGSSPSIVDGGAAGLDFSNLRGLVLNDYDFENDAHTVKLLSSQFDAPARTVTVQGVTHKLVQINFRFSSEHTRDNRRFPLEMQIHLVTPQGAKSAIAVLFRLSKSTDNTFLTQLEPQLAIVTEPLKLSGAWLGKTDIAITPLVDLLDSFAYTFKYQGSMTTPPCTEGVNWYVMESVDTKVSVRQQQFFHNLLRCDPFDDFTSNPYMIGNRRTKLPANGRQIQLLSRTPV